MEFQKNWLGLHRPKSIQIDQKSKTDDYAKFTCQPLEKGYGVTIGNTLEESYSHQFKGLQLQKLK